MDYLRFPTYANLRDKGSPLTYADKLNTREWKKRREESIARDKCTCQRCKRTATPAGEGYHFPMDADKFEKLLTVRRKEIEEHPFLDLIGDGTMLIKNNLVE